MGDKTDMTEQAASSDNATTEAPETASPEMEAVAEADSDATSEDAQQQAEGDAGQSAEADSTQAEIDGLNEQLQQAKDQALRAAAEMQNVRRRSERDVENAHKYGQEKLINSLLPVLDNLDRAIEAIQKAQGEEADQGSATIKTLLEGVELTRKSAMDALQGFKVEVLEPYGEPFDPQFHEAMTMVPSETAEPNSVIDVLQKGYSLNGRLLRAAMVVVAKSN